jgi:hypothetical protein
MVVMLRGSADPLPAIPPRLLLLYTMKRFDSISFLCRRGSGFRLFLLCVPADTHFPELSVEISHELGDLFRGSSGLSVLFKTSFFLYYTNLQS